METLDEDFANDSSYPWAIVLTAGGKYIGQITDWRTELQDEHPSLTAMGAILETARLGHLLAMSWPQEFHSSLFPRAAQGGAINFERLVQAYSVGRCLDIENATIYLKAADIMFFADMAVGDRVWHQELVRAGINNALEARAQAAGILTPKGRGGIPGHA